ncbi:hypothetical protein TNCV_3890531 [Trichonephila clavipes]|nr:hypothetical protein TNCV_3890531 [Trichonephila clavipes]
MISLKLSQKLNKTPMNEPFSIGPSPTTIDEVRHSLKATFNDLPVSVVQVYFDSLPNQVRADLAARGLSCVY